jgi:phosphopantetheine--protein transferase-like protein
MHIGIDIIEADRFIGMDNEKLTRMFSAREIEYFHIKNFAPETIAGLFCAKEAFFKALGTGITQSTIMDVEVLHGLNGAPYYKFSPKLIHDHRFLSTASVNVSISNTKHTSVAVCLISPSSILM